MDFEFISEITEVKTIATGTGVHVFGSGMAELNGGKSKALLRYGYLMVGFT
jgi:hypothetical protein